MSRGTWTIRRARKTRRCTECPFDIAAGEQYLYGAEPPESDGNTTGRFRIWAACLLCAKHFHLHTEKTRAMLEEAP